MSTIRWTEDAIDRLLGCTTDDELMRAFPGRELVYLRRQQMAFRAKRNAEQHSSARQSRGNLALAPSDEPSEIPGFVGDEAEDDEEAALESLKDRQISRLKDEINRLRRLYKAQTKDSAGIEALVGAIHDTVPTMRPVRVPRYVKPAPEIEEESLVLLLGDLHIGEVVDPEQTAGISVFNVDIARQRVRHTIDTAISIAKDKLSNYRFQKINVFLLGDLVSGIIHDELRVNDEVGIVGQCIEAVDIIAEAILKLCQVFPEVHVASVVGNHGRVSEEKYFKGKATNNYDYLVSKMLEKFLAAQSNLTWNIPKSFFTVETVENESFLLLHGDVVKSWMGIPFYGLQRAYLKWRALHADYGFPFKHMIVGHYHNPNMMSIIRYKLIINGCIKGGDEYSIGAISAACDPSQTLFGVHPRKGITHYWEINSGVVPEDFAA
jgi:hypothetical protein